jgi:hypothetical protein
VVEASLVAWVVEAWEVVSGAAGAVVVGYVGTEAWVVVAGVWVVVAGGWVMVVVAVVAVA